MPLKEGKPQFFTGFFQEKVGNIHEELNNTTDLYSSKKVFFFKEDSKSKLTSHPNAYWE